MPYDNNSQLPEPVKQALRSESERTRFRGAFNACMYDNNGDETKCFRVGYAAARKAKSSELPVSKALVAASKHLPPWAFAVLNREKYEIKSGDKREVVGLKKALDDYCAATVELLAGRKHKRIEVRKQLEQIIDTINDRGLAEAAIGAGDLPGWAAATLKAHFCGERLPVAFVIKEPCEKALEVIEKVYQKAIGEPYIVADSPDNIDTANYYLVALGNGDHVAKCDIKLPHPLALIAKGDKGALVRKSFRIKKELDSFSHFVPELNSAERIEAATPESDDETGFAVKIKKDDKSLQIVTGIVLEPFGGPEAEPDTQGDFVDAKSIETAAHEWMRKSRVIGLEHAKAAKGAAPVESYLVPYPSVKDYNEAMKGKPHKAYKMALGSGEVVSGSWVVSTKLDDALWKEYLDGKLAAYSMGGVGARSQHKGDLPKIQFVEVENGE